MFAVAASPLSVVATAIVTKIDGRIRTSRRIINSLLNRRLTMSYQNDLFVDNCVMRLVQLACAIRQNNDALARQEFDAEEIECQEIDGIE